MAMTTPSQVLIKCKTCGGMGEPHKAHRLHCIPCAKRKQVEYVRKYRARVKKDPKPRNCKWCGTEFVSTHGLANQCADCRAEYHRNYSKANRERVNGYTREYRKRHGKKIRKRRIQRRKEMIDAMSPAELEEFRRKEADKTRRLVYALKDEVYTAYGGWRCACCGETERSFLTIDHVNQDGAKMRKSGKHSSPERMYRWLKKKGFPDGYQILCMNCQFGRKHNDGVCPHQKRCND